jgi:hypothetical protein
VPHRLHARHGLYSRAVQDEKFMLDDIRDAFGTTSRYRTAWRGSGARRPVPTASSTSSAAPPATGTDNLT